MTSSTKEGQRTDGVVGKPYINIWMKGGWGAAEHLARDAHVIVLSRNATSSYTFYTVNCTL
jgi:hypothetical protein